jgi:hypothetical protein
MYGTNHQSATPQATLAEQLASIVAVCPFPQVLSAASRI